MDWFDPTGKVSKKLVHFLRWTTFPARTGLDRTLNLWRQAGVRHASFSVKLLTGKKLSLRCHVTFNKPMNVRIVSGKPELPLKQLYLFCL